MKKFWLRDLFFRRKKYRFVVSDEELKNLELVLHMIFIVPEYEKKEITKDSCIWTFTCELSRKEFNSLVENYCVMTKKKVEEFDICVHVEESK